jgi:anti-sigma regulatory factor (Ser/Thr protein kinase)
LHARQLLGEWGLSDLSDDVELLVSELVTNATQASRLIEKTIPVRMWLLADEAHVLILVWDASTHTPVRASVSEEDESGRGLLLVEAISDSWGYFPHETRGKVVWALTRMP